MPTELYDIDDPKASSSGSEFKVTVPYRAVQETDLEASASGGYNVEETSLPKAIGTGWTVLETVPATHGQGRRRYVFRVTGAPGPCTILFNLAGSQRPCIVTIA